MPKNNEHLYSKAAIALVIGGVALADIYAPHGETISEQTERIMDRHPIGRLAVHLLVWTTAAHLTRVMPEKYDWLTQVTRLKRQK